MTVERNSRRLLLAANASQTLILRNLLSGPELRHWQVVDAHSLEQAHFVLQHDGFDALLVDESLWQQGEDGLAWVLEHDETPAVLLITPTAELLTTVLEAGASLWLPREM